MELAIWVSEKVKPSPWESFREFVQQQVKRLVQGHFEYGPPCKSKNYMTRLEAEVKAYRRTGNREHLLNAANYCWLESEAPQNRKYHWDNTVLSVTRRDTKLRRGI